MQIGMIGLGRMGANMTRRIMRAGHECIVYDASAPAVATLASEGAFPAAALEDLIAQLAPPRTLWMMLPAAVVESMRARLAPLLRAYDVVVDGGNSEHRLAIARA